MVSLSHGISAKWYWFLLCSPCPFLQLLGLFLVLHVLRTPRIQVPKLNQVYFSLKLNDPHSPSCITVGRVANSHPSQFWGFLCVGSLCWTGFEAGQIMMKV
ncbi:hypothetical protein I3843_02G067600 [Carya illinoinensis]|nr:hypothetical protein I3843_02G067600 [Carya illinoinensis]